MKLNNSNKRISNIIAGILLVFVAIIFIAIASGVIRDQLYLQYKTNPSSGVIVENNDFVPVALECPDLYYHTKPGCISVVDEELLDGSDYLPEFEFPLCFNPANPEDEINTFINNWFRVYRVCGGYTPCEDQCHEWSFDIYQYNEEKNTYVRIGSDLLGTEVGWGLTWSTIDPAVWVNPHTQQGIDTQGDCCSTEYYYVTIDASCLNGACVDSDQWPECGCTATPLTPSAYIPYKALKVDFDMYWCGCVCEDQCFELILVQISRIPNSRINI
jgi:hypothetical protein